MEALRLILGIFAATLLNHAAAAALRRAKPNQIN